jgi:hypothetical protein
MIAGRDLRPVCRIRTVLRLRAVSGCAVGCGPVAWAILFGWGDRQAAQGNAYWAGRNGLYRQNGGRGADAVAPITQTVA